VPEVRSEVTASVWRVLVAVGDAVTELDTVVILEAMKMEIPVLAGLSGTITSLEVEEGGSVVEGDLIAVIV